MPKKLSPKEKKEAEMSGTANRRCDGCYKLIKDDKTNLVYTHWLMVKNTGAKTGHPVYLRLVLRMHPACAVKAGWLKRIGRSGDWTDFVPTHDQDWDWVGCVAKERWPKYPRWNRDDKDAILSAIVGECAFYANRCSTCGTELKKGDKSIVTGLSTSPFNQKVFETHIEWECAGEKCSCAEKREMAPDTWEDEEW